MQNEHIIGGLLRKRADLAGEIAAVHDRLKALQTDLGHVEATVRLFKPDIDFTHARVSRKPGEQAAGYGEMSKAVRAVLRDAQEPLTIRAVAAMVTEALDLEGADPAIVEKRVGASLRNLKARGQAESRHGAGLAMEWRLSGND